MQLSLGESLAMRLNLISAPEHTGVHVHTHTHTHTSSQQVRLILLDTEPRPSNHVVGLSSLASPHPETINYPIIRPHPELPP